MNVLTYSEARASFKNTMENVCLHHDPTIITRQRGEHVVMMSLADYNSMEETMYLLSRPKNAERLMRSIVKEKDGKTQKRGLITSEQEKTTEQRSS